MRIYGIFIAVFIIFSYIFTGCDSVSDSKGVSVSSPTLVYPANLDSNVVRNPLFKWSGSGDKLQIDLNSSFNPPLHSVTVTDSSYQWPSLLDGETPYFWRVGKTVSNVDYWSGTNYFKTRP